MPISFFRPTASPRRRMNMFYLVDTSASMKYKSRLDDVNRAMSEVLPILRDVSSQNHDMCEIYLSCIQFGSEARLIDIEPVNVFDYEWHPLEASGYTNLRDAYAMLEQQMHRGEAMSNSAQHVRPAVFLISDGCPDDGWLEGLETLRTNEWFQQAYKIAIAIGCKPENYGMQKALTEFARPLRAGGDPMIINVRELSKLRDVIRMVSATVSEVGSRNVSTGGTDVSTTIGIRIRQTFEGQDGILVSNPAGEGGWY